MLPTSSTSHCLLLVRSTLEVASVLKSVYPRLEAQVLELEREVEAAGQHLLDAGSVARARTALDRILQVRLSLERLSQEQSEAPQRAPLMRSSSASTKALPPTR